MRGVSEDKVQSISATTTPAQLNTYGEHYVATGTTFEVERQIRLVFGENADMAVRIAKCESGLRTDIISRTSDVGVMQINLTAHWNEIPGNTRLDKIVWLQNIDNNLAFAYQLFKRSSWNPWVCLDLIS